MKLFAKITGAFSILFLCTVTNIAFAVQNGGSYFWLTSTPSKRVDWYCYAMDNYADPTWSKYSWCTTETPNGNVYWVRNWINVTTSGIVCATGAGYSDGGWVYSDIPTNSTNVAKSSIWHNTAHYSHNAGARGHFQVIWTSTAPLQNIPTTSTYTASSACP